MKGLRAKNEDPNQVCSYKCAARAILFLQKILIKLSWIEIGIIISVKKEGVCILG